MINKNAMKQRATKYYPSIIGCLFLSLLTACISLPPHQQISEAKQALNGVIQLTQKQPLNERDYRLFRLAKDRLKQAEQALQQQHHEQASLFSEESKRLSQTILRNQQNSPKSNIKFRY